MAWRKAGWRSCLRVRSDATVTYYFHIAGNDNGGFVCVREMVEEFPTAAIAKPQVRVLAEMPVTSHVHEAHDLGLIGGWNNLS